MQPLDELIDIVGLDDQQLVKAVSKFYWQSSKQIARERTKLYQLQLKATPRAIKIERTYQFWGRCTGAGEITYNYLLSILPMELIDYIVVHELCHIQHMNHDRSFWRRVGSVIPNYKSLMKRLEGGDI